ncbi:MAG: hypothetical protein IKI68_05510, partial [Clostridia bacterium]|nr:hypothetical protein [Clostridia bacterium]
AILLDRLPAHGDVPLLSDEVPMLRAQLHTSYLVTALAGSGPAFVYLFAEALADGGVACGLPRDKATQYAARTLKGAATMLVSSDKHPGELKDAVCSPGGTTIEGVHVLENGAFRGTVMEAVIAAYNRAKELK